MCATHQIHIRARVEHNGQSNFELLTGISGLVVEYIVAIDVTRARFPADAQVCGVQLFGAHHRLPVPASVCAG